MATDAFALPEVASANALDPEHGMNIALETLRQQRPIAEAAVSQQNVAGAQTVPQALQQSNFVLGPTARRPSRKHPGG